MDARKMSNAKEENEANNHKTPILTSLFLQSEKWKKKEKKIVIFPSLFWLNEIFLNENFCSSLAIATLYVSFEMITTKNNSNVGNLISGAVNLCICTQCGEKQNRKE